MARGLINNENKNLLVALFDNSLRGYKKMFTKDSSSETVLKNLQKRGYIKRISTDEEKNIICQLSKKGIKSACLLKIKEIHGQKIRWDGKWRVVVFDIPEDNYLIRDLFRRFLKEGGFKQLQKSVWVTPFAIEDELAVFIKQLKIERWVYLMVVQNITNADSLLRKFDL